MLVIIHRRCSGVQGCGPGWCLDLQTLDSEGLAASWLRDSARHQHNDAYEAQCVVRTAVFGGSGSADETLPGISTTTPMRRSVLRHPEAYTSPNPKRPERARLGPQGPWFDSGGGINQGAQRRSEGPERDVLYLMRMEVLYLMRTEVLYLMRTEVLYIMRTEVLSLMRTEVLYIMRTEVLYLMRTEVLYLMRTEVLSLMRTEVLYIMRTEVLYLMRTEVLYLMRTEVLYIMRTRFSPS
ncbi:unnamed protein product [Gadus morhua 'NCC']